MIINTILENYKTLKLIKKITLMKGWSVKRQNYLMDLEELYKKITVGSMMDNFKMVKTMDIRDLLIKLDTMNNVNIKMVIM